jgi:hypothetical protein
MNRNEAQQVLHTLGHTLGDARLKGSFRLKLRLQWFFGLFVSGTLSTPADGGTRWKARGWPRFNSARDGYSQLTVT